MEHNLSQTVSLLARMPGALDSLLRNLPETWTAANEGDNTWNVVDVLAHLIHTEKVNWMIRTEVIMQFGDSRVFDPLDREGPPGQNQGKPIGLLLDEFAELRSRSLVELSAMKLEPSDLERKGRHPVFGEVNLSQLLATWAVHDLTHLHQISRVMAHQYREAVGPWSGYLGVLKCAGHSSP